MQLLPADIILEHGSSFSARLIQFITHSYWNHAALVVIDDVLIEANKRGRFRRFALGPPNKMAIYRIIYLNTIERDKIVQQALKYEGRVYDFLLVLRLFQRLGLRKGFSTLKRAIFNSEPISVPHIKDQFVVCSELVQEVYRNAGYPLCEPDKLLFPGGVAGLRRTVLRQVYGVETD